MSHFNFHDFLQSGNVKGFFTYEQFWHYWTILREKYPQYITEKFLVGKTYFGDDMHGFYMGEEMMHDKPNFNNKNIVFITALHHSREPLTVTMILYIMLEILRERGVCHGVPEETTNKWKQFFETNVIYFIPMVNIDSYKFIGKNWKGEHSKEVLMIRKNRNVSPSCSIYRGGVDLNRNYSFMFGTNEEGSSSDPCEEDYRGTAPFSEPETKSIKDYVDSHDNIVTAINMHTYGNAWVYPFNFVHDSKNELLKKQKPKFYKFYEEFVHEMKNQHEDATFGNAQATVNYPTNGEAGDWITEIYNVIDMDVELGTKDKRSERFYPPISLLPGICQYNFNVFRQFFWKHNLLIKLNKVTRNPDLKTYTFILFNKSISSLKHFKAHIKPQFKKHSRKLLKKVPLEEQPWHVIHFEKLSKKNKKNSRKLEDSSNHHWTLKINASPSNKKVKSELKDTKNGEFEASLTGRHYLILEITFANKIDMDNFTGINLDIKFGYDQSHSKEYYFDSYAGQTVTADQRLLYLSLIHI